MIESPCQSALCPVTIEAPGTTLTRPDLEHSQMPTTRNPRVRFTDTHQPATVAAVLERMAAGDTRIPIEGSAGDVVAFRGLVRAAVAAQRIGTNGRAMS